MKSIFYTIFCTSILLILSSQNAWAQKPLKGNWVFDIMPAGGGSIKSPVTFKSKGKGTVTSITGLLPMSYREKGNTYSLIFEGPMLASDGSDATALVRGNKLDDNTLDGKVFLLEDTADPSNPFGFKLLISNTKAIRMN